MPNIPSDKLHSNWVPISLIAILVPILTMGIQSYTETQRNTRDIDYLHTLSHDLDVRLLDKVKEIDDKISNSNISIAEIKIDISYLRKLLDGKQRTQAGQ